MRDAHTDTYPDPDSYSDINANTDFHPNSYSDTFCYAKSNTEGASDSTPSPDAAVKKRVRCDQ